MNVPEGGASGLSGGSTRIGDAGVAGKSCHAQGYRHLALCGILLLLLTIGGLALHEPGAGTVGTPERKSLFVALLGVAALVHFRAVAVVFKGVPRNAVWLVIVIALAARIGPLLAVPFLSSDVYRYVWDGRVQAAGINPYAYIPADPALTALRDADVFPRINRAETAPTIYPPAAQAVFAAIGVTVPGVTTVKAVMVAFEALAVAAAAAVCRRSGLSPARIVVWLWNPLAIWAFAGNGHIDAMAAGLLAATFWLAPTRAGALAGIAFGAAVLTKFLPLAAAPALWPRGGWRGAIVTAFTVAALYACYAGVGWRVLGFLPGYGADEGLTSGRGFWLLAGLSRIGALPAAAPALYTAVAALLSGALAAWVAFVRRPMPDIEIWRAAGWLMACATVFISPHYPWYFAWLALPAVVAPSRTLIWLATAPVLLYVNPFPDQFVWPSLVYLPALALARMDFRRPLNVSSSSLGDAA